MGGEGAGLALDDPGVPLPQIVALYGGATSKRGGENVLCSVCGGVLLCQLVTHASRNSCRMVLAVSKESFAERPPQASWSRSQRGGEREAMSAIVRCSGDVGSSQERARVSRWG